MLFILPLSAAWLILCFSSPPVCFQSAWRRRGLSLQWISTRQRWGGLAFELSLTEASSHSQAVHQARGWGDGSDIWGELRRGRCRRQRKEAEGEEARGERESQEINKLRALCLRDSISGTLSENINGTFHPHSWTSSLFPTEAVPICTRQSCYMLRDFATLAMKHNALHKSNLEENRDKFNFRMLIRK